MTTETTERTPATIAEHVPSVEALASLIAMFGHLPKPYITLYTTDGFALQLDHPTAFEAWRTALQLPTEPITLHATGNSVWLDTSGVFRGVRLDLTGFGVPLTQEQAQTPQERPAEAVSA